jgi:hypothetical protein
LFYRDNYFRVVFSGIDKRADKLEKSCADPARFRLDRRIALSTADLHLLAPPDGQTTVGLDVRESDKVADKMRLEEQATLTADCGGPRRIEDLQRRLSSQRQQPRRAPPGVPRLGTAED